MIGTNIFSHVSDEAKYVYLKPFVSPGSAFESGGDVQSKMAMIHESAITPIPVIPYATSVDRGVVEKATQAEANGLTELLRVLTPKTLHGVDQSISPATDTKLGNLKELRISDLTRDYASSDSSRMLSYRRLNDMMGVRKALVDNNSGSNNGFVEFANLYESYAYDLNKVISPLRTWNLIKKEIGNPWTQATETKLGIIRTIHINDAVRSDASIAISVKGIDYINATTSKRGVFKLLSSNYNRNAKDANEYVLTPNTMSKLSANSQYSGFFKLPSSHVNDSTQVTNSALGFELSKKISSSGGTITGTLKCDNIYSSSQVRRRMFHYMALYYMNSTTNTKIFNNNQLDGKIGLAGRPVGSIYHSTKSTNPSTLFGGVWYRISGGQTMMGQGTGYDGKSRRYFNAGTHKSDFTVTLNESHLPEHKHKSWGEAYATSGTKCVRYKQFRSVYGVRNACVEYESVDYWRFGYSGSRNNIGMAKTDNDNYMYYTSPQGGNKPHENMMPYYPVYIWRRIK